MPNKLKFVWLQPEAEAQALVIIDPPGNLIIVFMQVSMPGAHGVPCVLGVKLS